MQPVPVSQFSLRVLAAEGEATDREAFEELATDLRSTLVAASQVTHVEQVSVGTAPEGTRGAEILGICTFIITAVQTGEALVKVVQAIRWCVARYAERHRPVRLNVAGMDVELTSETDVGPIVAALLAQPGRPIGGVRRALIVANAHYDDPALAALRAPTHDANALAQVLGAPSIGGFDVELLADADEPTVRRRIATFFAGRDRDDLLLVHFSGHGVKDTRGRLHLATRDTDLSSLNATAVPASFLSAQVSETQSRRVVVILDCCYSGAISRDMVARASSTVDMVDEFAAGAGRVVLTASSATEYAFEDGGLTRAEGRPSVFTSALVTGLATGDADLDGDGEISIDELYDYTFRQVRRRTPDQTPTTSSLEVEGSLIIARSVRPAKLPDAVLDDVASDRQSLRLDGVAALARIAGSGRSGPRAAAIAALAQLSEHDDSSQVRRAAAAALAGHPVAAAHQGPPGQRTPLLPASPSIPRDTADVSARSDAVDSSPAAPKARQDTAPVTVSVPPSIADSSLDNDRARTEWHRPARLSTERPALSRRVRRLILAGVGGAVLVVITAIVLVATLTRSTPEVHVMPSPTVPPTGTIVFWDDFSGDANGWDASGKGSGATDGGYYQDGAYRYFVQPVDEERWAGPQNAGSLFPSAPPNLLLGVDAHWIAADNDATFGLSCRATIGGGFYALVLGQGYAAILKAGTGVDFRELASVSFNVDLNAGNQLQAMCATGKDNSSVHLVLWVNGRAVAEVTDTDNPLMGGAAGVAAGGGRNVKNTIEAEFDDFVATRI